MGGALSFVANPVITAANVLASQRIEALQWYAVQTRYRCEQKAVEQLSHKDVEAFLPQYREVHRWSDRQKAIRTPLFSGYVFVHLAADSGARLRVLRTSGVIEFVTFSGKAVPIPAKQIEDLRVLLTSRAPCALHAFLKTGQKVRIRGGCLDGVEGVLAQHGEKFLVISVDSIERSVAIKIEGYDLEMI